MAEKAKVEAVRVDEDSLVALEERFRQWRDTRKKGARIPAPLWLAAVDLARRHGIARVGNRLRLNTVFLQRRLEGVASPVAAGVAEPEFVELLTAPAGPTPALVAGAPAASVPECVVELHNARGATMRVELNAGGLAGLAHLCRGFWGAA
jgi:hypothetical protein